MEENEYKSTYGELTRIPCVYEKALTNQKAQCDLAEHFCLADREGYACESLHASNQCQKFLECLREKSIFSLKIQSLDGPLPHNMEIRIQAGGLQGLMRLLENEAVDSLIDSSGDGAANVSGNPSGEASVHKIIERFVQQYKSVENFPYSEIVRAVSQFKGRQRRKR